MQILYRAGWLPKGGCSSDEYEDAFAPADFASQDTDEFRCAVADGATETSFSGLWARLLCEGYVSDTGLESLQNEWLAEVSKKELPWYAEQKLESGAYAALVCLSIKETDEGFMWQCKAIGDCCLFHIRGRKLLQSFPVESWHEFTNSPLLMASRPDRNELALSSVKYLEGICQPGDFFYLMSDAISNWFLRRHVEQADAIDLVEKLSNESDLIALCSEQRHAKDAEGRALMPNDDVTLVRVEVS